MIATKCAFIDRTMYQQTHKCMFICMFNIDILIILSMLTGKEMNISVPEICKFTHISLVTFSGTQGNSEDPDQTPQNVMSE